VAQSVELIKEKAEAAGFENHPDKTVTDLVGEVTGIIPTLDGLRYNFEHKELTHDERTAKDNLIKEKNRRLLALLFERAKNPNAGISVTLHQYPAEEFHPFSENTIEFNFPDHTSGDPVIHSELSRIGEEFGLDSLQIIQLIGRPDQVVRISPEVFIKKTHEEMRHIQRDYRNIAADGNSNSEDAMETCQYLTYLRHHLTKAVLLARLSLSVPQSRDIVRVELSRYQDLLYLIFPPDTYRLTVDLTPELLEIVDAGGGFDDDETDQGYTQPTITSEEKEPSLVN